MSKPIVYIHRQVEDDKQALGFITVEHECIPKYADVCLELSYINNEKKISSVTPGMYNLVYTWSPRFERKLWLVENVDGRSGIRIHAANYHHQLNGCIAPGTHTADIDGDGYLDVTSSLAALNRFHKAMEPFEKTGAIIFIKEAKYSVKP
ncbi:MAG TPA: DUF5675 family protein [Flavobacteriaceae bacterium]|nr:DUF5675 family protein [Flavobacteriaceae bacterium]